MLEVSSAASDAAHPVDASDTKPSVVKVNERKHRSLLVRMDIARSRWIHRGVMDGKVM
jgi:hypothetical protein